MAERQHGVISRVQLLAHGLSPAAIKHRVAKGRLHVMYRGVYAIGRPQTTRYGRWMAAVLTCGPEAALSHESAAALWGIRNRRQNEIDVSVPTRLARNRPGIRVHRKARHVERELTRHSGIPVTTPASTLVDIAVWLTLRQLEAAVNEADASDLIDPVTLRSTLEEMAPRGGVAALRKALDRRTFALTDSELERRFLRVVRKAELPPPHTGCHLNGFKVDFFWPDLGLVVETDGLRYHRTPAKQARDRVRDQAHAAAGLTQLRFTHAQIKFQPDHVRRTLSAVARRLQGSRGA